MVAPVISATTAGSLTFLSSTQAARKSARRVSASQPLAIQARSA
jgi:hypothetical protein